MSDSRRSPAGATSAWFLLVVGAALAAYARSFDAEFQFDDSVQIVDNTVVHHPTLSGLLGFRARFLPYLSFALDYRLGGDNPVGYHIVNLVLHILVCFAVYRLALALCRTPRLRDTELGEHALGFALAAALLVACHPIQVQAVTYVVQRLSVMATLFYVTAVLGWVRYRTVTAAGGRAPGTYAAALLSALAASLSKQNAASLPLAILLVEWVFFRRAGAGSRRALVHILPFAVLTLALAIPNSLELANAFRPPTASPPTVDAGPAVDEEPEAPTPPAPVGATALEYLLTQCRVIPAYLRLVVFPVGFNIDHDVPIERRLSPPVVAGLALLVGLFVFGLYAVGRWAVVGFGVLWLFVALSVESSLLPIHDVMNEHRMYLAMPGIALVAGAVFAAALKTFPTAARLAGGVVIVLLTALTIARNETWRTQLSLWQDALAKSPGKARVHVNLGTALHLRGELQPAIAHYCEALKIEPTNLRAQANIIAALEQLVANGQVEMEVVRRDPNGAIELTPRHPCPPKTSRE